MTYSLFQCSHVTYSLLQALLLLSCFDVSARELVERAVRVVVRNGDTPTPRAFTRWGRHCGKVKATRVRKVRLRVWLGAWLGTHHTQGLHQVGEVLRQGQGHQGQEGKVVGVDTPTPFTRCPIHLPFCPSPTSSPAPIIFTCPSPPLAPPLHLPLPPGHPACAYAGARL